jgi:hypothetical protein
MSDMSCNRETAAASAAIGAGHYLPRMSHFQSTLLRVLVIQVITLVLLWLLQSRYTA